MQDRRSRRTRSYTDIIPAYISQLVALDLILSGLLLGLIHRWHERAENVSLDLDLVELARGEGTLLQNLAEAVRVLLSEYMYLIVAHERAMTYRAVSFERYSSLPLTTFSMTFK